MPYFYRPGHLLKLESSASSPVAIATSLEVPMPHQPTTFSFPKRQFEISKSKFVIRCTIVSGYSWFWCRAFMELHGYIIYEVADSEQ